MKKRKSELKGESTQKNINPIELLKEDHKLVKKLFDEFEDSEDEEEKAEIVEKALIELKIHATIEEEIFYPASRKLLEEDEEGEELLDEAKEEHHVAHLLMEELNEMDAEDEGYFAKFTVLAENVRHHIKEEEGELMPKLKSIKSESQGIGEEMMERKLELKTEAGGEEKSSAPKTRPQSRRSGSGSPARNR
jgi:hemerythrin superfamily protein